MVDGGSTDETCAIADAAGTQLIRTSAGAARSSTLVRRAARGDWLLFLHADTVLEPGWAEEAQKLHGAGAKAAAAPAAASFRFALDDDGFMPRIVEGSWSARAAFCSRCLTAIRGCSSRASSIAELGGFRPIPLMEDVDLVRRLKRRELVMLKSRAVTSGERYRREGYVARTLRNLGCMLLYYPPRAAARARAALWVSKKRAALPALHTRNVSSSWPRARWPGAVKRRLGRKHRRDPRSALLSHLPVAHPDAARARPPLAHAACGRSRQRY